MAELETPEIARKSTCSRNEQPRLVHQIIALALFKLLLNTGRRFIYPFAPALSRSLDVPFAAITTIIATSQFVALLGLFCGPLADRLGYRTMMKSGLAFLCIGMLLCGLLPVYWLVFLGLIVASFGKTLFDPAVQAFIGENIPFHRRGRVIGIVEMSWAGSTLIGIPIMGLVIDRNGLGFSFYLLSLLGFIGWICINRILPKDAPGAGVKNEAKGLLTSLTKLMKVRPAAGMLAFGFFISIANDSIFVVYGRWFESDFNVSLVTLGFSTVAIGIAELCGESSTALFADKIGLKRATIIGLLLAICAYLLLPFIGVSLMLAMVGMFFVFGAFEFTIVSSFSLCTELMPQSRATMMAGFYAASGVGRMLGVLIGTPLWHIAGISGVAWTSAALTGCGLLALLWGLHGWTQQETDLETA